MLVRSQRSNNWLVNKGLARVCQIPHSMAAPSTICPSTTEETLTRGQLGGTVIPDLSLSASASPSVDRDASTSFATDPIGPSGRRRLVQPFFQEVLSNTRASHPYTVAQTGDSQPNELRRAVGQDVFQLPSPSISGQLRTSFSTSGPETLRTGPQELKATPARASSRHFFVLFIGQT